ncbi:Alpha/beta hydrolase fold-1 [Macrophomina phaseolina MS6]|uniref:Alpha/beta hydrolase fold-1 n=1 Tax=Macrophomina phaseolina (strain MS6) TaxID=1126212 RepID=K2RPK2_MACPH|nr:Alpha/beta hydrolase fold-1 [Macrophomina phaseolina MS6]
MEDPPPATSRDSARKRRSLPISSTSPPQEGPRRPANRVRPKPASPEVISSLIDSLSAISLPAQDHFENLPRIGGDVGVSYSVPASPAAWQPGFQNGNGGFGVEYGVYRHERWEEEGRNDPDLDDAAEPPVIKTAPPPSGYSPITAPNKHKRDKEGSSLKNYILSTSKSCSSLNSKHSSNKDDASSIASSITRGLRRHSTNSRASLESKRSVTKTRSLGYTSSRERLRSRDSDSICISSPPSALWSPPKNTSGPPSPRKPSLQSLRGSRIDEVPCEGPSTPPRKPRHRPTPINTTPGPAEIEERGPRWPDDSIPSRTSSLRHKSQSPAKHKRISSRSRSRTQSRTRTVIEEDEPMEASPESKGKGKQKAEDLEQEEDTHVTRRIKELKRKKELRDKEFGELRLDVGGEVQEPPRLSPSMRTPLSPITRALGADEQRPIEESLAKAHRMLGLAPTEIRRSLTSPLPLGDDARPALAEQNGVLKNDVEDELPIDYKLALQSLARSETASSDPSKRLSLASMGRSHTIAGRPSAGANMSAMMKERNKRSLEEAARKLDLHINLDTPSGSRAPSRAASAESAPSSRQSLFVPSTLSVKRSNSSANAKKKRWSHPDIPLKAEQKHNAKVDQMKRDSMQVKTPIKSPQVPEAVIEEPLRPTSGDSVDDDVDAFLYSPRLTQKVREPNTGRTICFSEVGDPEGFAVFVCVGMGLTRYVTAFYDELATSLKLRLITPDRPGVGESQADPHGTPLSWPDDVLCICQALKITKFSIMAHSAGAIYALATALRLPQHIRGRVHLLAPWIPPSQMTAVGLPVNAQTPERQLPRAQRFLRVLPTPLLKVANSSFMSATSASITRSVPKSPQRLKRRSYVAGQQTPTARVSVAANKNRESMMLMDRVLPNGSALEIAANNPDDPNYEAAAQARAAMTIVEQERRREYDTRLTLAVWDMATTNANPAVDLLVCLERTQPIGFRYVDITRAVVIHHGSRDTRVPVENVKWLGRTMKRCEVRILEGENHGLMASAVVMGNVLTEMAREWEDWTAVVKESRSRDNLRAQFNGT